MAPKSAQLLLLISTSMGLSMPACLLPPDYNQPATLGPYPPQVNLETLKPRKPKHTMGTACDRLDLLAEFVDLDSTSLSYRWVANNGDNDNELLAEDSDSSIQAGAPQSSSYFLDHASDFSFPLNIANYTGVVSLFVTDAPPEAWVVQREELMQGEPANFGLIEDPNDRYSVIEVRWTFEYLADLGNTGCNPD